MGKHTKNRRSEQGNVLFLILIAVALFAALSYAVTQSTRSGGGSAEREQSLLSGASMTQYPAALRTSLIRMILNGTSVEDLMFNPPSDFAALVGPPDITGQGVFHPSGGGAVYQQAPANLMANGSQGQWHFNAHWDIPDIGVSNSGAGNDIVAFLPGVSAAVCRSVNDEFAITVAGCTTADGNIPDLDNTLTETNITQDMDDSYTFPTTDQQDISNATCTVFSGQPSGCFNDTNTGAGRYVFYSVLLER